jgi:hypothetical protein
MRLSMPTDVFPLRNGPGQGGLEFGAEVVLVADDDLAGSWCAQGRVGVQDVKQDGSFVGLGSVSAKPTGRPCRVASMCRRSPQT